MGGGGGFPRGRRSGEREGHSYYLYSFNCKYFVDWPPLIEMFLQDDFDK